MILDYKKYMSEGVTLKSSGTTGIPKDVFQSPHKLKHSNICARDSQRITKTSKIYTVCKLTHAGGLLAQTLPALEIGADVVIEQFNAYEFVRKIGSFTHTHLTPAHAEAIMSTKGFWNLDMCGIWVTCGSDRVSKDIISAFISRGATFMANWGMSEIGPCAINKVFTSQEQIDSLEDGDMTIMGDTYYCDTQIINGVLHVKGDICVYDEWFNTGDIVKQYSSGMYYIGRSQVIE